MKPMLRAATFAAAALVATTSVAETRLIANEPGPNRGVRAKAVEYFGQLVAERSKGDLVIDQNWGGALFKAPAALENIGQGVADLGLVIGAYAPSEMPALAMGDMPLTRSDPWVAMMAMAELFSTNDAVKARLEEMNIVYLGHYSTSDAQLACKGPGVATAEDIAGKKMRRAGVYGDILGNLGANLVDLSIYKAYQGMETGLIDCSITYAYFAVATKMHELIDTLTPMEFSTAASLGVFMNKYTWDSLSAEQQAVLTGVREDVINYYAEKLIAADAAAMKTMAGGEKPVQILAFSAAEKAKLEDAAGTVFTKWKKNASAVGYDADALLAEYKGLLAKYNNIRDTQGYPWARK